MASPHIESQIESEDTQTAAADGLMERRLQQLTSGDVRTLASPHGVMRTGALDETRSDEGDNAAAANADAANADEDDTSDTRCISDDSQTNFTAEGDAAPAQDAAPSLSSHAAIPVRHVGHVRMDRTPRPAANLASTPPRRRAASVFGTCGSEIVTYPARAASAVPNDTVAAQTSQGDREREAHARGEAGIVVEEEANGETETLQVNRDRNDDANAAPDTKRRIYVRFKTLPAESSTAYIRVLLSLFTDYPGEDGIALVFDEAQLFSEDCAAEYGTIAAPNGVDYDEISEAVQNIAGEDAVVEILESKTPTSL